MSSVYAIMPLNFCQNWTKVQNIVSKCNVFMPVWYSPGGSTMQIDAMGSDFTQLSHDLRERGLLSWQDSFFAVNLKNNV